MKSVYISTVSLVLCILLSVTFIGCIPQHPSWEGKRPCDQMGTSWESENGEIWFDIAVTETNGVEGVGNIYIDGKEIPITLAFDYAISILVYSEDRFIDEYWVGQYDSKDCFTATVKRSTYFDVEEKITFYRVDSPEPIVG